MKKFFFSALICSLLSIPAFAYCSGEDGEDTSGGGDGGCLDPDNAPLDSGTIVLFGLTALYGVQRLRSSYKKEVQ
ncbi:hypothetical protein [Desertivirga arenae]|uniref:hypothetical protein n=1 Tax=Desertivirga arenae TaxID=2810309 RepID=UPI001A957A2C|nr:hypothetical protein [Pedobacter sp. SYSU D00823]